MRTTNEERYFVSALPLLGSVLGFISYELFASPLMDTLATGLISSAEAVSYIGVGAFSITALPWIFSKKEMTYDPLRVAGNFVVALAGTGFIVGMLALMADALQSGPGKFVAFRIVPLLGGWVGSFLGAEKREKAIPVLNRVAKALFIIVVLLVPLYVVKSAGL